MHYVNFAGETVSRLGFGAMRLPQLEDGSIDEAQVNEMVAYAFENGVNYFDTAYPYHNGLSEILLSRALKQFPRSDYFLATKYPGHQIAEEYDPADIFEEQLKKCDVDYFDFYLLHNVYEKSLPVYFDSRWGIVDYFVEQRRAGRIKKLGFSTHAMLPCLTEFLERYGSLMDFAQIQMNYLDWSVQDGPEKYELLAKYGLDVIVMEPVRGGSLADLGEQNNARLKALEPDRSVASWALRWQLGTPAKVVLSGMSTLEQTRDNVSTFNDCTPLSADETKVLEDIAAGMQDNIPCTACGYCTSSCPQEIDIPTLMHLANDVRVAPSFNVGMQVEALEVGKRPQDCIGCQSCEAMCPQNIPIAQVLHDFAETQSGLPSWEALCKARAEAAAKLRAQGGA